MPPLWVEEVCEGRGGVSIYSLFPNPPFTPEKKKIQKKILIPFGNWEGKKKQSFMQNVIAQQLTKYPNAAAALLSCGSQRTLAQEPAQYLQTLS